MRVYEAYDRAFKAKVSAEARKDEKKIQKPTLIHGMRFQLNTSWKSRLIENLSVLFERPQKVSEEEQVIDQTLNGWVG